MTGKYEWITQTQNRCGKCNRRLSRIKYKGVITEVCPSFMSSYPYNVCPHDDWDFYFVPDKRGARGHYERRLKV